MNKEEEAEEEAVVRLPKGPSISETGSDPVKSTQIRLRFG